MSVQSLEKQTRVVDGALEPWQDGGVTEGLAVADTPTPLLDWRTSAAALVIWRRMLPTDMQRMIDR